jgi:hypothetical protein
VVAELTMAAAAGKPDGAVAPGDGSSPSPSSFFFPLSSLSFLSMFFSSLPSLYSSLFFFLFSP